MVVNAGGVRKMRWACRGRRCAAARARGGGSPRFSAPFLYLWRRGRAGASTGERSASKRAVLRGQRCRRPSMRGECAECAGHAVGGGGGGNGARGRLAPCEAGVALCPSPWARGGRGERRSGSGTGALAQKQPRSALRGLLHALRHACGRAGRAGRQCDEGAPEAVEVRIPALTFVFESAPTVAVQG